MAVALLLISYHARARRTDDIATPGYLGTEVGLPRVPYIFMARAARRRGANKLL